jgi:prepilin-type N-terminal cleavage/methylation domain-containing protein
MKFSLRTDHRGSTLIESLVALALFGLTASAVGDMLMRQIRMQGTNMTRTTAIALAERELEDLRSLAYKKIDDRTSTQTVAGMTYTIATTVTDDSPADNMKSIATRVSWTEPAGAQTYTINAIYTAIKR